MEAIFYFLLHSTHPQRTRRDQPGVVSIPRTVVWEFPHIASGIWRPEGPQCRCSWQLLVLQSFHMLLGTVSSTDHHKTQVWVKKMYFLINIAIGEVWNFYFSQLLISSSSKLVNVQDMSPLFSEFFSSNECSSDACLVTEKVTSVQSTLENPHTQVNSFNNNYSHRFYMYFISSWHEVSQCRRKFSLTQSYHQVPFSYKMSFTTISRI